MSVNQPDSKPTVAETPKKRSRLTGMAQTLLQVEQERKATIEVTNLPPLEPKQQPETTQTLSDNKPQQKPNIQIEPPIVKEEITPNSSAITPFQEQNIPEVKTIQTNLPANDDQLSQSQTPSFRDEKSLISPPNIMTKPPILASQKANIAGLKLLPGDRVGDVRGRKKTPEQDKIEKMLALIRNDLPNSSGPGQRMFFPQELPFRLQLARKIFIQHRHKIPERAIALSGVMNLLDQLERVHGGPFDSAVAWDEEERDRLREMIGEFKETPQKSFSFGLDDAMQHRLRMASEYTGAKIRQIVATGMELILQQMEGILGRPFNEAPRIRKGNSQVEAQGPTSA